MDKRKIFNGNKINEIDEFNRNTIYDGIGSKMPT